MSTFSDQVAKKAKEKAQKLQRKKATKKVDES